MPHQFLRCFHILGFAYDIGCKHAPEGVPAENCTSDFQFVGCWLDVVLENPTQRNRLRPFLLSRSVGPSRKHIIGWLFEQTDFGPAVEEGNQSQIEWKGF